MKKENFYKLRDELKDYLTKNSKYNPIILATPKGTHYPMVIFYRGDSREVSHDNMGNSFNRDYLTVIIYAKDMVKGNKIVGAKTILYELEDLVKDVFIESHMFRLTSCQELNRVTDNEFDRKFMTFQVNYNRYI